eukprot:TRINITY_DN70798_c3_g1_i1.p3 TRINITY_DN70798_c3_g1~~TRINITY_DN70798_c3_g1_i1.p3  ORF type:complete len:603 (+),score=84.46 TRINITY_DN70798_c3_g1_i1:404-2212(+)
MQYTKFLPESQRRDIMWALQKLFAELKGVNLRSVTTETLTQAFHWYNHEELEQHDVQELNRILFDLLERALRDTKFENEMHTFYKQYREATSFNRGKYVTQTICEECKNVSEREEIFSDIPLQIKGLKGVNESLCQFASEERLEGDNKYFCERCNKKVSAIRRMRIRHFPPILTLGLNRFEIDWSIGDRKKVNDNFAFPLELDVMPFKESPDESSDNLYELKAVIIHRGGAYGGHYHAYIRDELEEGAWNLKVPEKYASEPIKEQKVVNIGLTKAMEENPTKRATMKAEEKEQELTKKTQETDFNFDECDFPIPYSNPKLQKGWFDFDDESVTAIPFGRLQKQFGSLNENAYMLIYKQKKSMPLFADPLNVPECWVESILTQNLIYEQQREFYKEEEKHIEVVFQNSDLFTFDEECMIKYKVDKGIEDQGFKIKVAKDATLAQLVEKLCEALKVKVADSINVFEINRCRNEYCHVIRSIDAIPLDTTLENAKVEYLSTWIYCEKTRPENAILEKVAGELNLPIEISVRFLGEDLIFHTYKGISLGNLKEMVYEKTTFPVDQQKIYMMEAGGGLKQIDDSGDDKTLFDLKFPERTQLMLEVIS